MQRAEVSITYFISNQGLYSLKFSALCINSKYEEHHDQFIIKYYRIVFCDEILLDHSVQCAHGTLKRKSLLLGISPLFYI